MEGEKQGVRTFLWQCVDCGKLGTTPLQGILHVGGTFLSGKVVRKLGYFMTPLSQPYPPSVFQVPQASKTSPGPHK